MPRPLNQTDTDLNADNLLRLPAEFGCPVWVYDAQIVREKIAALHQFDVVRFAQKACSNIHVLRLMREQGVKVDSVSLGEIERALAAGFDPKADGDDRRFDACARPRAADPGERRFCGYAGAAGSGFSRPSRLAARESGLWSWPQPKNQYRRRKQQARDLVCRYACRAGGITAL